MILLSTKKIRLLVLSFMFCFFGVLAWPLLTSCSAAAPKVTFEWLVEPRLSIASDFRCGVAWIREERGGTWKQIDKDGKVLIRDYEAKSIFHYDEKTKLAVFKNLEGFYGYIDLSGKVVISPQYWLALSFRDGVAFVAEKKEGRIRAGAIDSKGKRLFQATFENLAVFHNNLFAAKKDGKWAYLNEKGEKLTDFIFDEPYVTIFPPNVCMAKIDNKVGLLDAEGNWILPPEYESVYMGREGLIALVKDDKVGFVDAEGKTIIDFKFPKAVIGKLDFYTFSEGLAVVMLSPVPTVRGTPIEKITCGVIDKKGEVLFTFQGIPRNQFTNGFLAVMSSKDVYGLVDQSGSHYQLPSYVKPIEASQNGLFDGILRVQVKKNTGKYKEGKSGYLKIKMR